MKIDRTRFLVLVSSLTVAAGGATLGACSATSNSTVDGGTGSPDSSTGSDGSTAGDSGGSDGGGSDGGTSGDSGGGDSSPGCLGDNGGTNAKCETALEAGTGCLGSLSGKSLCDNFYDDLKAGVADTVFQCLQGYPSCESGLAPDGGALPCGMQAALAACPDTNNAKICDYIDNCLDAGAEAGVIGTKADCINVLNGFKTVDPDAAVTPPSWVTNISQCTAGCTAITQCLRGF